MYRQIITYIPNTYTKSNYTLIIIYILLKVLRLQTSIVVTFNYLRCSRISHNRGQTL